MASPPAIEMGVTVTAECESSDFHGEQAGETLCLKRGEGTYGGGSNKPWLVGQRGRWK